MPKERGTRKLPGRVSTSNADPRAISKKCAKSSSEVLDAPSAILEAIETAAR